jgi:hypothetical protein
MKPVLVILALMISCTGYSQSAGKDSSASCIAYWKAGEEKTYTIIHEKITNTPDKNESVIRFAYQVRVSVIDATANDYTIKWVFQLPDSARIKHPEMADSLPVYNGLQMLFRISEMGTFIELLNWEEVRDAYISMGAGKSLYTSRKLVEAGLIREIQLFHMPYGYKFTTKEMVANTRLPNPFGGDPFPAHQIYRVTELNPLWDQFTLVFQLKLDKSNMKSKMGAETYDMEDYTEYHFIQSTGWISSLFYKRTTSTGGLVQSDAYTIQLEK